jgi:hypothetical protein
MKTAPLRLRMIEISAENEDHRKCGRTQFTDRSQLPPSRPAEPNHRLVLLGATPVEAKEPAQY